MQNRRFWRDVEAGPLREVDSVLPAEPEATPTPTEAYHVRRRCQLWGVPSKIVEPNPEHLVMYGSLAATSGLDWRWVDDQLATAAGYWIIMASTGHPHPRPVWGIWHEHRLALSVGSPTISAEAVAGGPATVHLGSVNDVVIVEGDVTGPSVDTELLDAYNSKYGWNYTVEEYGPFTVIEPAKVIAWRSAGWGGRDGFQTTGRWTFS